MTREEEAALLPPPGADSAWVSVAGFRVAATLDADNNVTHLAWVPEDIDVAAENS